jgi:transposase
MIVLKSGSFAAVVFLCSWCTDYPLSNRSRTRCTITRSYARALVTMPLALPVHLMSLIFHQLFDLGREPKDVAQEHGVTPRAVRRWKQNWRLSGTPRAPKGGCKTGRPRVCTPMQEESLFHHINEDPSIYLDEMAWYLFDCFGVKPCIATVFNILTRDKWSRKRATKLAAQRNDELRAIWLAKRLHWRVDQLVFLDETASCERTGDRKYGWSPIGHPCTTNQYLDRSLRYSVLPALTVNGYLDDPLIVVGGVTADAFAEWFEETVIPQLQPDSIVVLDNAKIHHGQAFKDLVAAHGVRIEYLPPYSQDYNPIEYSFNALKLWVKRNIGDLSAFADFEAFMRYGIEQVKSDIDARGWFRKCQYCE